MPQSTTSGGTQRYGRAAFDGLLSDLAAAPAGGRNATLNRVSMRAARLAAAGALDWAPTAGALEACAMGLGLAPSEVAATLRSAYHAGVESPATVPSGKPRGRRPKPAPRPVVHPESPSPRPPRGEVEALWDAAAPVTADSEASDYLASRGILPKRVELYDLARAIPPGAEVPRWAACRGARWSATHRLIARGWGATGAAESLHARCVGEPPEGLPKGLWPAAGPGSARGLVLADGWGRQILGTGSPPDGWRGELVIAEGLPDWLSWCVVCSDGDEDAPAVLGLTAGSWAEALAARVPDGTRVVIATHADAAGDRYAAGIAGTFSGRKVEVRRWAG